MEKAKAKMGRPTDYKPEYCEKIIEYFNVEPHRMEDGKLVANDMPTFAGFAVHVANTDRHTLHAWCKKYPDFNAAYNKAKELQEQILATNGLQGLYNPSFAIFTAKNVVGWRDKIDTDVTSKGEKVSFTVVRGGDSNEEAEE